MRLCPACGNAYDDQLRYCPVDATALWGTRRGQETPPIPLGEPAAPAALTFGELVRQTPTGAIYEATLPDGTELWAKRAPARLFPSPMLRDRALRELRLLCGAALGGLWPVRGCGVLPDGDLYVLLGPPPSGAEPLDERVRQDGILSPDQARHIVLQVGGALKGAQERGVLHRSLAPAAVYLDEQDNALLMDFGLAEVHEVHWRVVQGPLPFLAPEQAQGRPTTERSLVYGLGALYYHLLTGVPPHGDGGPEELLRRARETDPTPPSRRRPGLPEEIDAAILRALRRVPEERQQGLGQFLYDIEALGDILPPRRGAPGPTPSWLLPSLSEASDEDITEQVREEDMVAVAWLEPPTVVTVEEPDNVGTSDEDIHERRTMPLPGRRRMTGFAT